MLFDRWILPEPAADDARIPIGHPALRSILIRRGIADDESYRRFVVPSIDDLHDGSAIHGMAGACERIERAVRDHEPVLIYGDYDVDGVTSIVLLQTVLRSLGATVDFVVPHRLVDGYGLKIEVLDRVLVQKSVKLVITVDCGITSVEPVRRALDRGIDVIITDHHLPPGVLPAAAAVLNPRQPGCEYPFKELAGVGVVFKLCCELIRRNEKKISIDSLLKIAAIGTIADVAPLIGENRTIAWLGLRGLADVRNPGLRALLRRIGVYGRPLRASDIGFKVGPRINAAGRLASANTAIDLFSSADDEAAWSVCAELDRMNTERQAIERAVREEAEKQVDELVTRLRGFEVTRPAPPRDLATSQPRDPFPRVLVLAGENWHRGVVGLTAGRIAQKYNRPTLVISIDGEHCVGSARSIPSINLHAQLERVADLFTHFGGHEFACGFALPRIAIDDLRASLADAFDAIDEEAFVRRATIDAELALADINHEFVSTYEMLEPFGAGNPQPLFIARGLAVESSRTFAEDCRELMLTDGRSRVPAVVWPSVRQLADEIVAAGRADVAFHVEADGYSATGARMSIVDARKTE